MKTLFIHGGPGFNSQPERKILEPEFQRRNLSFATFDEPSNLRDHSARESNLSPFDNLCKALQEKLRIEKPNIVISHSWGLYPLFQVLSNPESFQPDQVILVSPIFDLRTAHQDLLEAAATDFDSCEPSKAEAIRQLLKESASLFDSATQNALTIALGSPGLMGRLWTSAERAQLYFSAMSAPEYQIDVNNYFQILADFASRSGNLEDYLPQDVSFHLIFGNDDFYSKEAVALERFQKRFPKSQVQLIANANHYPHIEKPSEFAELVARIS